MTTQTRSTEQELSQLAALLVNKMPGRPACELDEADYLDRLDYHGISLLAQNTISEQLNTRKVMMVANEQLKKGALNDLFDALNSANLHNCILFKGSALAYSIYPDPWLRPRADNDLLIDRQDYHVFCEVLQSLGYSKSFAIEGNYVSYQSAFSKPLVGHSVMNIDLHWKINNRQCLANSFSVSELLSQGVALTKLSSKISVPCNIDSLLIASLHRLGHHASQERLTWLYDIHLLSEALSTNDWELLVNKAKEKRLCAITLNALQRCEQVLGSKIPTNVVQDLALQQKEPSRIFLRSDLPEWRYFVNDVQALSSPSAKLGLLRETLFPSTDYIRQQMDTNSATLGYCKRLMRGLKRVSRAP